MDQARGVSFSPGGRFAYVTGHDLDLAVVDVQSPTTPAVVESIAGDSAANLSRALIVAIGPEGNFVYATVRTSDSLAVINVTYPTSAVVVGSIRDATYLNGTARVAIAPDGDYALWLAVHQIHDCCVVDVSVPTNPS